MEPRGRYIISVAAELSDVSATTLRRYERAGLLTPRRTRGGVRLYSDEDVARLLQIRYLTGEWGASLVGISLVMQVTERLLALRALLEAEGAHDDLQQQAIARIDEMLSILGR